MIRKSGRSQPLTRAFDSRWERNAVLTISAALLLLHLWAVWSVLRIACDHDEAEYLHASWLMGQGLRIYRDFMEDHPPFFFRMLLLLAPARVTNEFPLLDVPLWLARARILSVFCGTAAAMSAGAAVARVTRNGLSGIVVAMLVAGSPWIWFRGILQARSDAPALLFFWVGVVLLVWDEDVGLMPALRIGTGMALVVAAELLNPKWPLCGLLIGAFFLVRVVSFVRADRRCLIGIFLPSILIAIGFAVWLASTTTFSDFLFFNVTLKSSIVRWFRHSPAVARVFRGMAPFGFCTTLARPAVVLMILLAVVGLLWRRRSAIPSMNLRGVLMLVALVVAAAVEVRFVYPYPRLWPQYYLMWGFTAAVLAGIALSLAQAAFPSVRGWLRAAGFLAGVVTAASCFLTVTSFRDDAGYAWRRMSSVQKSLRPGDTVWLDATEHPIGVRDASFFWYSEHDLVPAVIDYIVRHPESAAYLPRSGDRDLPPCRILRGELSSVLYLHGPVLDGLPESNGCIVQLERKGQLRRAFPGARFDVVRRNPF